MIGSRELALMMPHAILVNTSRAAIVDQQALVDALRAGVIGGAGLDVFDAEPMPADHPLRRTPNTVVTPHIGYFTRDMLKVYYEDAVEAITAFLDGRPMRVVNPVVLASTRMPAS